MSVSVTNSTLSAFNTDTAVTKNAATSTTIDETEVFTVTPTRPDDKVLILLENGAGHGAVSFSIAAGGFWGAGSALTGTVADGATDAIVLEGFKYKAAAGTVAITMTPASGKRLLTDHAFKMTVVEMY